MKNGYITIDDACCFLASCSMKEKFFPRFFEAENSLSAEKALGVNIKYAFVAEYNPSITPIRRSQDREIGCASTRSSTQLRFEWPQPACKVMSYQEAN